MEHIPIGSKFETECGSIFTVILKFTHKRYCLAREKNKEDIVKFYFNGVSDTTRYRFKKRVVTIDLQKLYNS